MRGSLWWSRLLVLEATNIWRARPIRHAAYLLVWFVPMVLVPLVLISADPGRVNAVLDWLLSFDTPMVLVLSAQTGSAIIALASRPDTESWVLPRAARGLAGTALFVARLTRAIRWPVGLMLLAALLSLGGGGSSGRALELQVIALFALVGGASLAWLLSGKSREREVAGAMAAATSHGHGLSVLSGVPLCQTRRRLNLRRLALAAVPVLLAVPMASQAQQVLRILAAWLPLLFVITWAREAVLTGAAVRRWMPHTRLAPMHLNWLIWRQVVLGALLYAVALWLGWRVTSGKDGGVPS